MSQSILWKLWRFSEILVEVWRNCWSLSETVGDESKSSLFPWVLLGGSCPEVSTGHCHTHGCVPGNSSSTFGNLHLPPCSIPSWCRWWLHPRLHRHCHRKDSSFCRWLYSIVKGLSAAEPKQVFCHIAVVVLSKPSWLWAYRSCTLPHSSVLPLFQHKMGLQNFIDRKFIFYIMCTCISLWFPLFSLHLLREMKGKCGEM